MKLLQDNKKLHAEEFSNASPYVIMFGPDKCGATNKVHSHAEQQIIQQLC
jgi:calnexin